MRGLQTVPTPGRRPENNHCRLSTTAKNKITKSNQTNFLYLSKVVYKKVRPPANIKIKKNELFLIFFTGADASPVWVTLPGL
jgi:hypothetical protein